jgi:hypothetical protein
MIWVSRPLRIEYPGAFYHVTSRGKETIEGNQELRKVLGKIEKEELLNVAV